ncbi:hypothetical protein [Bosea sp. BIWAKO-01]|uniref:hypothetical protein n=1 Tax=Bosea sp. BIWAKO-01 TaxID=506668 RepID=UPI000853A818|nr:hypothetical protein [Bosea sp. BIWAKO-01]GAU86679.1 hypothetical protein BIWAKO_06627 [Bosea sp. BIWAKO-01]
MFDIFKFITEKVREQATEYAEAQAQVGSRQIAAYLDPFGLVAAVASPSLAPVTIRATKSSTPRLANERRPVQGKRKPKQR